MSINGMGARGAWIYPAAGNSELAWEFTQHLLSALENPETSMHPVYGAYAFTLAGRYTPTVSIRRATSVEAQVHAWIGGALEWDSNWFGGRTFAAHTKTPEERAQEMDAAVSRIARYNEMPISRPPLFPAGLVAGIEDVIEQLVRGTITPESAAQQIHNRVFLWLIE